MITRSGNSVITLRSNMWNGFLPDKSRSFSVTFFMHFSQHMGTLNSMGCEKQSSWVLEEEEEGDNLHFFFLNLSTRVSLPSSRKDLILLQAEIIWSEQLVNLFLKLARCRGMIWTKSGSKKNGKLSAGERDRRRLRDDAPESKTTKPVARVGAVSLHTERARGRRRNLLDSSKKSQVASSRPP